MQQHAVQDTVKKDKVLLRLIDEVNLKLKLHETCTSQEERVILSKELHALIRQYGTLKRKHDVCEFDLESGQPAIAN